MSQTPPVFSFEIDNSLTPWNLPGRKWITKHNKSWDGLATGCIVFNPQGKVLIIQRASHDSMPNRWEVPGGAADDEDATLFHSAARELWEEAGLIATRFTRIVSDGPDKEPGQVFPNSTKTRIFCRFSFIVDVVSCEHVRIDASEHQGYLWATEEEVRAQRIGERELPLTNGRMLALVWEAFRLRRETAKVS